MHLFRDIRYALHTLRTSPAYAIMCIAVLALGIGANAAIFSVLNTVIFDALPYPNPSQLVFLWERFPGLPAPVGDRMEVAHSNYLEWKRQATLFSDIEAYRGMTLDETAGDHPRHVKAAFASPGLFHLLGAQARTGHLFTATDDRTAVLSDIYFQNHYHGDPAALGRTLTLDGAAYTVVGVLPPRFHVPSTYEGDDQVN
ncbi:MAG TPA: ABC transporter permease, partial [Candidatus Sulfopaludibacter sp.]|nr:ABC transporter permease [Candidatus Sulfopaludibacter sp.]